MEDYNTSNFRNLWQLNMSDLENQCKNWEKICINNQIPDEVHGEIRTTIGLARLLMNQKLKQFKGLIDDSEFNRGEKKITCSDLQGFWDMVYFEVEKINKCFDRLDKCKNNEWKFVEENSGKPLKKKVPVTKDTTVTIKKNDSSKSRALAARQRLAEAKQKMLAQREQQKDKNFVEIIPPSEQEFNSIKALAKESNKKFKNLDSRGNKVIPGERNEPTEECLVVNNASKQSAVQQNKENFLPTADTLNIKCISATQAKSKMKTEVSVPGKTRRKTKEIIKLQCITRSAKKAMLAQQNTIQES